MKVFVKCITKDDPYLTYGKVYEVFGGIVGEGDVDITDDEGEFYFMFDSEYEAVVDAE